MCFGVVRLFAWSFGFRSRRLFIGFLSCFGGSLMFVLWVSFGGLSISGSVGFLVLGAIWW